MREVGIAERDNPTGIQRSTSGRPAPRQHLPSARARPSRSLDDAVSRLRPRKTEPDREEFEPAKGNAVVPPDLLGVGVDTPAVLDEPPLRRPALQAGEWCTDAHVPPHSEREVVVGGAFDVETVWIGELLGIPVGGPEEEAQGGTGL